MASRDTRPLTSAASSENTTQAQKVDSCVCWVREIKTKTVHRDCRLSMHRFPYLQQTEMVREKKKETDWNKILRQIESVAL